MAIHQQRIPLKGYDESIDTFTALLKEVKENAGQTSADVLIAAIADWKSDGSKNINGNNDNKDILPETQRIMRLRTKFSATSRAFYLQVLTSTEKQRTINLQLESLRLDPLLRNLLGVENGLVGRNEYLLEALIYILQIAKMKQDRHRGHSQNTEVKKDEKWPFSKSATSANQSNQRQVTSSSSYRVAADERSFTPSVSVPATPYIIKSAICQNNSSSPNAATTIKAKSRCESVPPPPARKHSALNDSSTHKNATSSTTSKTTTNSHHTKHMSWRQRLRRQQLEENKELCDMVRRSCSRPSTPFADRSTTNNDGINDYNSNNGSCRNNNIRKVEEQQQLQQQPWEPVHQEAIRKLRLYQQQQQQADKENSPLEVHAAGAKYKGSKSDHLINKSKASSPAKFTLRRPMQFQQQQQQQQPPSFLRHKYDLSRSDIPILTIAERRRSSDILSQYLRVQPSDARPVPRLLQDDRPLNAAERARAGVDCDEVSLIQSYSIDVLGGLMRSRRFGRLGYLEDSIDLGVLED